MLQAQGRIRRGPNSTSLVIGRPVECEKYTTLIFGVSVVDWGVFCSEVTSPGLAFLCAQNSGAGGSPYLQRKSHRHRDQSLFYSHTLTGPGYGQLSRCRRVTQYRNPGRPGETAQENTPLTWSAQGKSLWSWRLPRPSAPLTKSFRDWVFDTFCITYLSISNSKASDSVCLFLHELNFFLYVCNT